jgi:hypothetical protein
VIVQIVPHLPPPFEGVGTYAAALAGALAAEFNVETRFVIGDPRWSGRTGNGVRPVPARTADALTAALGGETTALVHYVNYGYQSRGCPIWLVEGLARWRAGAPHRRLVAMFHEVWASGPPWRSSFWLQPLQRRLAAAVAGTSRAAVTSLELYGNAIRPLTSGRDVRVLPVFSTLGEPVAVSPLEKRARRIVVFGGAGVRRRAYGRFLPALAEAASGLAAEEICDIGPALDLPPRAGNVPIRPLGVLPSEEVSEILLDSTAGFLAYPPDFLPKSTIFAAYCAHGVLPVCAWNRHPQDGPVAAGRHYWRGSWTGSGGTGSGELQAIASAAHGWYGDHTLSRQAGIFHRLLSATGAET